MAIRWTWAAIILSIAVQAYVLYYAYHYGTLRGLLQWDDCAFFLRGFKNLDRLAHAQTVMSAVIAVRHFEIHAPLSDIQTAIGLLLSGGQIWGPYLLNATWLALVLVAIVKALDSVNWALVVAVTLFLLIQPVTIQALTFAKGDWTGGLLMAGALVALNAGTEKARPDLKFFAAVLLGLSILTKLTAFYLPILALAILLLFEWHWAGVSLSRQCAVLRPDARQTPSEGFTLMPRERNIFLLSAALAAGPFMLFFGWRAKSTVGYIDSAMGSVWDDHLTTLERVGYYSPFGKFSWATWGHLHIFFVIFVGAALWVAWRRRDFSYLVSLIILLLIGVVSFIPLIVPHTSNVSFAATFLGVFIAATLISMNVIARSMPRWGSLLVLLLTLLIALPTALPFQSTAYHSKFPVGDDDLNQLANTYARIVDVISQYPHQEQSDVVVCFDDVFAPHPNLAIKYFQKTGRWLNVDRVDDIDNGAAKSQLLNADFILTVVPSVNERAQTMPNLYPAYPISHDPARAEAVVHSLGRFSLVGTFPVRGGDIHLYAAEPVRSSKEKDGP